MSTPCCQSLRSNRLVASEFEVPKVWFPESAEFFMKHPVSSLYIRIAYTSCDKHIPIQSNQSAMSSTAIKLTLPFILVEACPTSVA